MARLTLSEIWIYPIKSLGGVRLTSAKVMPKGLRYDRRWMLIDEENQFITQRNHPNLSQFYPNIKEGKIEVSHHDNKHEFSISESLDEPIFSKVWDDESKAVEVNKATSKWFSEALGFSCKLVKIGNRGDEE